MLDAQKLRNIFIHTQHKLSLAEISACFPDIKRRTLQRWLATLVNQSVLVSKGEGRARRYGLATIPTATGLTYGNKQDTFPDIIPRSPDSQDILVYIEQPMAARKPVGYQFDFLEQYEPNITRYLSESMQAKLANIGNTGQDGLPAGTYARAIFDHLLIDLSWASSQLEGNTYSRADTRELIQFGKIATGKDAMETQMILNHKAAIEFLLENIDTAGFNRYTICNLHSLLAEGLLPDANDEGRIRLHEVSIGKSVYQPLNIPAKLDESFNLILEKASQIINPFEQSFFIMVHLSYLQAFADVNKRTARLAANLPLLRTNLCPLTFIDVPEPAYSRAILGVYELTRIELLRDVYLWAYERSAQEYHVIRQGLVPPDPLRIKYRALIKSTIFDVVTRTEIDTVDYITSIIHTEVEPEDQESVQFLIMDSLRLLHEGVLARYGLRPSQLAAWKAKQR